MFVEHYNTPGAPFPMEGALPVPPIVTGKAQDNALVG